MLTGYSGILIPLYSCYIINLTHPYTVLFLNVFIYFSAKSCMTALPEKVSCSRPTSIDNDTAKVNTLLGHWGITI